MNFELLKNVPHPSDEGFAVPLKPLGWWISDNAVRMMVEMAHDWDVMDAAECDMECGPDGNAAECPYGEMHGRLCIFADELTRAVKAQDEESEVRE